MSSILIAIILGLAMWWFIREGGPWSRFVDRLEDKR